ncbi:twin-arginine translocation pathway signal protein [Leisingera sp. ANG-M1]|uniref:YHS domain-containing (seleno)protein n=1 Tax=Leisingera sp. ANG-M1 TaxID=1577895 RepID=UPI00057CFB9D|nr:YHS domain-containing (seleno)protein [Leisingera sp. ANG-M1]KIC07866.1 twin-arginine translocation pathway signal protein [Leisingera sp. ANG-M1]
MEKNVVLRLLLTAAAVMFLTLPGMARADAAVFSSRGGVAIGGYDAVAFFEDGTAEQGRRSHAVMWKGAVWRFSSARNQARFEANPRAYAPAFGGYCAYAMSQGMLMDGNPQLWAIVDGELFLLNNAKVQKIWTASQAEMIVLARGHWPVILRK